MLKIVAVLLPLLLAAPAFADEAPPASDNFALVPATGQYLRIDRRSGEVSLCAERDATWQCQLLADDRAALEGRLTDLEREVARLKAENAALKASAAPAGQPETSAERRQRLDEFLGLADRMFQHFFDMVDRYKSGDGKPI